MACRRRSPRRRLRRPRLGRDCFVRKDQQEIRRKSLNRTQPTKKKASEKEQKSDTFSGDVSSVV